MASETTNLHLVKPDQTEAVDVAPLNGNCDKIDEAYAALAAEITNKVEKVPGKGLSTEDYTTNEKEKLAGLVGYDSDVVFGQGTALTENSSFNDYKTIGTYYAYNAVTSSMTDGPFALGNNHLRLDVISVGTSFIQKLYISSTNYDGRIFIRRFNSAQSVWTPWYVLGGEYLLGTSIASNADLNSYTTPGVYNCTPSVAASLAHCPTNQSLRLEVKNFASASSYVQTIITPENTTTGEVVIYRRLMLSGAWKPWYKFTGTVVT